MTLPAVGSTTALILLCLSGPLSARQIDPAAKRAGTLAEIVGVLRGGSPSSDILRLEGYSVDEGLSQSTAKAILQDRHGFLWVGTQDGLNKFDGHEFIRFVHDPEDPASLPHSHVQALFEDRAGNLWVGTSAGLSRLVAVPTDSLLPFVADAMISESGDRLGQERFENLFFDSGSGGDRLLVPVIAIADDARGGLWVGTGSGLSRLDPRTGSFRHFRHDPTTEGAISEGSASFVAVDGSGVVWVVAGGVLNRYDPKTERFTAHRHDPEDSATLGGAPVRLFIDRVGDLWIGTTRGVDRLSSETGEFEHYVPPLSARFDPGEPGIEQITQASDGSLWFGSTARNGGLLRLDPTTGTFSRSLFASEEPGSPTDVEVWVLMHDRSGILWMGTGRRGLVKVVPEGSGFAHLKHDPTDAKGLSHNYITGITEGMDGSLWVGTGDGGLNRVDPNTGVVRIFRHDPADPTSLAGDYPRGVLTDRSGVLWVTGGAVLTRYDPASESFIRQPLHPAEGLREGRSLSTIHEDEAGLLWVGGSDRTAPLLYRLDLKTGASTEYVVPTGAENPVEAIQRGGGGMLWIGTRGGGLWSFEPDTEVFTPVSHEGDDRTSLGNPAVQCILQDSRGRLWIGTRGGGLALLNREDGTFRHYREKDGLANDVVYGILEDDHGLLWISTNRGISRFDPEAETFHNYDVTDGLQSNEFNRWAYFRARNGTMAFGGINGLTLFHPDALPIADDPPQVALTSVRVRHRLVASGRAAADIEEVRLKHTQNFFSFDFVALHFGNPAQNQYSFRLEGFDDGWAEVGTRRYANYTNVPPGEYVFRVRAANSDGVWNDDGLSLAIVIAPPFWTTWWFMLLSLLAAVGALYGLHKVQVGRLLHEERTRTRIARDLHDDLSATMTSISYFAHAIEQEVGTGRTGVGKFVGLIARSSAEAKERIHDIVWSINPEHDSWESLLARCRRFASDLLGSRGIHYEIDVPSSVSLKPLSAGQRHDFWLIYKEVLTNAAQHARCDSVRIRLRGQRGEVHLEVSDDGVGFEVDGTSERNGLRNIEARADRLGAALDLRTAPGEGTRWRMTVQL